MVINRIKRRIRKGERLEKIIHKHISDAEKSKKTNIENSYKSIKIAKSLCYELCNKKGKKYCLDIDSRINRVIILSNYEPQSKSL